MERGTRLRRRAWDRSREDACGRPDCYSAGLACRRSSCPTHSSLIAGAIASRRSPRLEQRMEHGAACMAVAPCGVAGAVTDALASRSNASAVGIDAGDSANWLMAAAALTFGGATFARSRSRRQRHRRPRRHLLRGGDRRRALFGARDLIAARQFRADAGDAARIALLVVEDRPIGAAPPPERFRPRWRWDCFARAKSPWRRPTARENARCKARPRSARGRAACASAAVFC